MSDEATTTETTVTATETETTAQKPDTGDLSKEVEKWQSLARKHEDRAKANSAAAKELEALKASTMNETEKAVAAAKAEGRTEALREAGTVLVKAEIRAAAAGRAVDIDALLDGIDPARFIDTDGNPDRDEITKWVDRVAPAPTGAAGVPNLGQGARGGPPALNSDSLTRDLARAVGAD